MDLGLEAERTALLLVDCTSNQRGVRLEVMREAIAPVLQAARRAGVRPVYLYESGHGTGGPGDVLRELAGVRPKSDDWREKLPEFDASVAPCPGEPVLAKWHYDGFLEGHVDYHLRSWGVDTIVAVGFRLPCCVFQTCLGARTRNYRVVLLRDCTCPPGSLESDETRDATNPESGWTRYVFLRWFETLVGFTADGGEFIEACGNPKND
jgi:nicotinamidase-related amidase